MDALKLQWHNALTKRKEDGNLRQLKLLSGGADFCSNDYLGLARNVDFQSLIFGLIASNTRCLTGATGARLISGNSQLVSQVEEFIAEAHHTESALLFPSGYKANLALFSCIAGKNDTILADELIHRSVIDGCQLSNAVKWKFRHNDISHLEDLLKRARGNVVIAVESLYSMDGDFAPLKSIVDLAGKYGAGVVVDEAHAMGVFGTGLVNRAGLQGDMLAIVATYGKGMGVQGAAVLGSRLLKDYLVNFASPFIYSTSMPDIQAMSIKASYEYLDGDQHSAAILQERIRYFRTHQLSGSSRAESPIQAIRFSDINHLKAVMNELREAGIQAYPMFTPTVKAGTERVRVCLHAFNTNQEIDNLCAIVRKYDYQ